MKTPIGNILQGTARMCCYHEDEKTNCGWQPVEIHPNHLVDATNLSHYLVAAVCDSSGSFQIVVVGAINDGSSTVNDDTLQVDIHRTSWTHFP